MPEYGFGYARPGAAKGGTYKAPRSTQGAAGGGQYTWKKTAGSDPKGGDYKWHKVGSTSDPTGDVAPSGPVRSGPKPSQAAPAGRAIRPNVMGPYGNGAV